MTGNRWAVLGVLFLARTAMGFQFQSVGAISPLLVDALGLNLASLGALIGAWMLPGVLLAIPGGLLGQRFGDKRVVVVGLAMMAAGSALLAGADDTTTAMLGRVLGGSGAVLLNVLLAKMVTDWFGPGELATAMALLVVSWPLGIGLGLVVLGPLAVATSWSFAIETTAWVCAAAGVAVLLAYRSPAHEAPPLARTSGRLARLEAAQVGVAATIWTFYNVGYIILVSFTPVLLVEKGFSPAGSAIVASFATWPLVATVPVGGLLADRTGRGPQIVVACLVGMALAMPWMTIASSPFVLLVMLAGIGLLAGPPAGIIVALPARVLQPSSRHLGMGLFFAIYYLGMATLPGVAGWLRGRLDLSSAPLLFASALLLAATALLGLFGRLERRRAASPIARSR